MKVIITGVSGQDGSNMAQYLLKNTNMQIFGTIRKISIYECENIKHITNKRFNIITYTFKRNKDKNTK